MPICSAVLYTDEMKKMFINLVADGKSRPKKMLFFGNHNTKILKRYPRLLELPYKILWTK